MSNNQYVASDGSVVSGISPAAYEAYLAEKASNQTPPPPPPANMAEVISQQMADAENQGQELETVPVPVPGGIVQPVADYEDDYNPSSQQPTNMAQVIAQEMANAESQGQTLETVPVPVPGGIVQPVADYEDDYNPASQQPTAGSYAVTPISNQPANMGDVISQQLLNSNQPQPIPAVNPFKSQKNTIKPVGGSVTDFAIGTNNTNPFFNTPPQETAPVYKGETNWAHKNTGSKYDSDPALRKISSQGIVDLVQDDRAGLYFPTSLEEARNILGDSNLTFSDTTTPEQRKNELLRGYYDPQFLIADPSTGQTFIGDNLDVMRIESDKEAKSDAYTSRIDSMLSGRSYVSDVERQKDVEKAKAIIAGANPYDVGFFTPATQSDTLLNNPVELISTMLGFGLAAKGLGVVGKVGGTKDIWISTGGKVISSESKILSSAPKLTLGGAGAVGGIGGRAGPIIGKVVSSGAKAGATLSGFGTLASVGGETDLSKETSKISTDLRQKSTDKLVSADTVPDIAGAHALGLGSGLIGGTVDMVGGLSSAGAGISKIGGLLFSGNFAETKSTLGTGFDNSMSGFSNYIEQIPTNPAYSIGELIGFSTAYGKVSKTIPKVTTAVGKQTGIIDARIVDTGNIVASENPLLSAAIDAGAVDSGGMLRLDTTSRVSITPSGIKVADNVGTKFTVKTTGGKKIATGGTSNPLSKTGDLDIQRLQPEYQIYGQSEGIPFTYGTASAKSGAGTVLGLLDQTPDYLSSSAKSALINAILPIQISPKGGRVIKYDMSDSVSIGGTKTTSSIPYKSGMMSDYYSTTSGKPFDTTKLSDIISDRQGFTPTITPKRASSKNEWRGESEREHAWTTADTSNPAFDVTSFGGYTSTGRKITNLGSDKSIFATLRENRAANIDTIKNPAVRKSVANRELNLKNAPKSVIDFYGRDAAFRLAEIVGKPSGMLDITAHGSKHVENVEKIAQSLKEKQPTYGKITKDEVYYASILHDVAKNTAQESVPGGHGEMVGSLIRSGSPLDARKYLKPEAVNEFNSILGVEGTKRYDAFLQGWDALPKTQKLNIADAITQHTTNLKGPLGQTHRVTANKLGKLISDADRVDLRRFSPNPADFTPKRSKTFASRKIIKETMNDVFGDTQNDIPDFTSTSRSNFASISQAKKAQPVKALVDKYSYKPTKSTPNLGFVYEKNGSTNKNYLPVDDSYRENTYAEQPSPYTANLDTKNYDLTGDSDYRQSYADTQPSYLDVSDYSSITPYMSTNPGYTSQIYGGSSAYQRSLIDTGLPVIRRKKEEKEDKNRDRRENKGIMDFFEVQHREIATADQFSGGLFGGDDIQTRDFYHLGFDAFMSKNENGIRTSARKRTVKPAVKRYAKVRHAPSFDLGLSKFIKNSNR